MQPKARRSFARSLIILSIGVGFLFFGLLVYLYGKGCGACHLLALAEHVGMQARQTSSSGAWIPGWLPSTVHVISFSLITNALLTREDELKGFCVSVWIMINLFFEYLQSDPPRQMWLWVNVHYELGIFSYWPMRGTFCVYDIAATFAGGALAYAMLTLLRSDHTNFQSGMC
ncbi:MAG: hypothetical protein OEZ32_03235 [Nitrospinota bacterium]|nr:hypothetical protein [Nitrospinota bacterium]